MKDEYVKDAAQGAAGDVGRGAGLGLKGPGGARPPRHATTAAAAVSVQLRAQLGSSVAFGSGCGQALPGVPRKAPLLMIISVFWLLYKMRASCSVRADWPKARQNTCGVEHPGLFLLAGDASWARQRALTAERNTRPCTAQRENI